MKKRTQIVLCMAAVIALVFSLSACSSGQTDSETRVWKDILTFVLIFGAIAAAMQIANIFLEFLAIKYAYIYWPICLVLTIVIFFMELNGGDFGSDLGFLYAHAILLYLLIPNMDDSIQMYSKITYEYDLVFEEWRESERKTIKEETPGVLIKLGVIAALLFAFFLLPGLIVKDLVIQGMIMLFLPLGVEGLISLSCSIMGITRLIKYHG